MDSAIPGIVVGSTRSTVGRHSEIAAGAEREAIAFVAEVDQDDGLTLRDIAVVLGVSYQRVHQLVHEGEPALTVS